MSLLYRRDSQRNMARFYALMIERSLFGDFLLIRTWGRIGTRGQCRSDWYGTLHDAEAAGRRLAERKRHRGYVDVVAAA